MMMGAIAVVLLSAVALMAAYMLFFSGNVRVERSVVIRRPPAEVFSHVADFQNWSEWSPWLIHDTKARLNFSEQSPAQTGGFYSWDSPLIGAGKITHIDITAGEYIEDKLEFVRPFKSVARTFWQFQPVSGEPVPGEPAPGEEEGTKVTWRMESKMPFLMRPFAAMLVKSCGMDFEIGLARLNGLLDASASFPHIEFLDVAVLPPTRALAAKRDLSAEALPKVAEETYPALLEAVKTPAGKPLMVYRKMRGGGFSVDMAVPVGEEVAATGEFSLEKYAGGKFFHTRLRGEYAHLKYAWYSAFAQMRMRKLKFDRRRLPMEIYENNPREVARRDCQTSIYLPVK